jgi:hypothetical protein
MDSIDVDYTADLEARRVRVQYYKTRHEHVILFNRRKSRSNCNKPGPVTVRRRRAHRAAHCIYKLVTMSKRDIASLSAGANVDLEPRTKRRKESQSEEKDDDSMADATKPTGEEGVKTESGADGAAKGDVKEQGLALWQTVKDAVNKECVTGNCKLSLCLFPFIWLCTSHQCNFS